MWFHVGGSNVQMDVSLVLHDQQSRSDMGGKERLASAKTVAMKRQPPFFTKRVPKSLYAWNACKETLEGF
jgi:hypothetical protein